MSHKIEGQLPPVALRGAAPGVRVASAGGDRSEPVQASAGGDSLRLTGEAATLQTMQREISSAGSVDAARVAAIRADLEAGTYKVDAQVIADRMLELERQLDS